MQIATAKLYIFHIRPQDLPGLNRENVFWGKSPNTPQIRKLEAEIVHPTAKLTLLPLPGALHSILQPLPKAQKLLPGPSNHNIKPGLLRGLGPGPIESPLPDVHEALLQLLQPCGLNVKGREHVQKLRLVLLPAFGIARAPLLWRGPGQQSIRKSVNVHLQCFH